MVNLSCSNPLPGESEAKDDCNNMIWTMKAIDCANEENQENLNRVHVLCCNKCDFLTISLKALQQHMTLLHSVTEEDFNNITIYSCQECKCVSTELKLIQEHIKIFHSISAENSSNSSNSEKVPKKITVLTSSITRNGRKTNLSRLAKTQLKIRKKILQRKSLKLKMNNFLSNGGVTEEDQNNNGDSFQTLKREIKKEILQHNDNMEVILDVDENDPLDMSMNSTTCPFKATNVELTDGSSFPPQVKLEPVAKWAYDNATSNSVASNPLLSNPQTCIELIKLTLGQMLNKTNEQHRMSHIGFNPAFLQPQFQLPSNIVPLILPTSGSISNNSQNTQNNDLSFVSKNPEIEALLANIQQQNHMNSTSPKSFDPTSQLITYQQSPMYLNHKLTSPPSSVTKGLFIDSSQKNGTVSISPLSLYTSKKPADLICKPINKRSLKKQPVPTKVNNGLSDDSGFLQNIKFDSPKVDVSNNENLFNRSFLDSNELEATNDQMDLSKVLDVHDSLDCHTVRSNKSSPNAMSNDKPHRQNFTSQQNRILSDWFFTHCDKPYPSTEDTKELSQLSGLTYSQVKKWFANKRARSSLNKKNHKNYCMMTPVDSAMDDGGNNDALSVSPSSQSHNSYGNTVDGHSALDFTTYSQDELVSKNN